MNGNKIYCIGSNLESYKSLQYLISKNCKIDTLITLPKGANDNVSDYYDLHDFCHQNGIKVLATTNVNSKNTIDQLKEEQPDYLFTLGWSQIFKQEFIDCFSGFIVGTHPSKLPYGRGRAPVPWTILEDLRTSAVSFFKIDTGVDTGKLIFQKEFDIPERSYAQDVYDKVAMNLGIGFHEIYNAISNQQEITLKAQGEEGATHRGKRTMTDGLIDFQKGVDEMDRLIRAVSKPFPGAYCYYKDKKVIFWSVALDHETTYSGPLGQIHKRTDQGILVQFADGNLWLKEPVFDDHTAVEKKIFRIGDRLGYNVQDEIFYLKNAIKKC